MSLTIVKIYAKVINFLRNRKAIQMDEIILTLLEELDLNISNCMITKCLIQDFIYIKPTQKKTFKKLNCDTKNVFGNGQC